MPGCDVRGMTRLHETGRSLREAMKLGHGDGAEERSELIKVNNSDQYRTPSLRKQAAR